MKLHTVGSTVRQSSSTTLAPRARARWTKARRTLDLPIPAIPCRLVTCVSPRTSSSRARSSASRPTKGARRCWWTAVAMTAVSPRAPRGASAGSDALDDRDRQLAAHLLLAARVLRDRDCHHHPLPRARTRLRVRRTEHVSPWNARTATRPRTGRGAKHRDLPRRPSVLPATSHYQRFSLPGPRARIRRPRAPRRRWHRRSERLCHPPP